MDAIVSELELRKITGRVFTKCQVDWLKARKWRHELNSNGEVVLLWSVVEAKIGMPTRTREAPVPQLGTY